MPTPQERYEACCALVAQLETIVNLATKTMLLAIDTSDTALAMRANNLQCAALNMLTDAELVIGPLERAAG